MEEGSTTAVGLPPHLPLSNGGAGNRSQADTLNVQVDVVDAGSGATFDVAARNSTAKRDGGVDMTAGSGSGGNQQRVMMMRDGFAYQPPSNPTTPAVPISTPFETVITKEPLFGKVDVPTTTASVVQPSLLSRDVAKANRRALRNHRHRRSMSAPNAELAMRAATCGTGDIVDVSTTSDEGYSDATPANCDDPFAWDPSREATTDTGARPAGIVVHWEGTQMLGGATVTEVVTGIVRVCVAKANAGRRGLPCVDPRKYCLRIMDDGEPDFDFPELDPTVAVESSGETDFALCRRDTNEMVLHIRVKQHRASTGLLVLRVLFRFASPPVGGVAPGSVPAARSGAGGPGPSPVALRLSRSRSLDANPSSNLQLQPSYGDGGGASRINNNGDGDTNVVLPPPRAPYRRAGSRTGSRAGSRSGSRLGSRSGSRGVSLTDSDSDEACDANGVIPVRRRPGSRADSRRSATTSRDGSVHSAASRGQEGSQARSGSSGGSSSHDDNVLDVVTVGADASTTSRHHATASSPRSHRSGLSSGSTGTPSDARAMARQRAAQRAQSRGAAGTPTLSPASVASASAPRRRARSHACRGEEDLGDGRGSLSLFIAGLNTIDNATAGTANPLTSPRHWRHHRDGASTASGASTATGGRSSPGGLSRSSRGSCDSGIASRSDVLGRPRRGTAPAIPVTATTNSSGARPPAVPRRHKHKPKRRVSWWRRLLGRTRTVKEEVEEEVAAEADTASDDATAVVPAQPPTVAATSPEPRPRAASATTPAVAVNGD